MLFSCMGSIDTDYIELMPFQFRKAFFMMVLGRDPFAKEGGDGTTGGETVGGNKVVPA